jgi:hypothetical protein
MAQVLKHGNHWMVVKMVLNVGRGINTLYCVEPVEPKETTFDLCWTGQEWAPKAESALLFDSWKDAADYVTEHAKQLALAT